MLGRNKRIFLGTILLIFFFIMGNVCANDIAEQSNISVQEDVATISVESDVDQDIQNIPNGEFELSDDNEEIFINPDFEQGSKSDYPPGWNVSFSDVSVNSQDVAIATGVYDSYTEQYVYKDSQVLRIHQSFTGYYPVISQKINFDNVDNISFIYCLPFVEYSDDYGSFDDFISLLEENDYSLDHTIEIYYNENLIKSYLINPTFGWQIIEVDTSQLSGVAEFKVKIKWATVSGDVTTNDIYLDNFTAVMAPVPEQVDSIISISSINANNVISGFLKDISGNPLANAVINYIINSNNGSVVTADDGSFSINGVDNYEIFINYLGNKTIKATSTSIKLDNITGPLVEAQANASKLAGDLADANQKISNLTTQLNDAQTNPVLVNTNVVVSDLNIKAGESGVLKVTLKDASGIGLANQTINVLINGKNYNAVTGNDGVAQVSLKYDGANTYYANIYYAGNNTYKSSIATGKVVVTKKATTLTAPKKTFKVKAKTKKVAITLKSSGKAVAGKKITIKIKGKTYSAKTNSKGVATIKVKLTKKGTYKYTAKFAGDNTYNTISKKGTIKVKK